MSVYGKPWKKDYDALLLMIDFVCMKYISSEKLFPKRLQSDRHFLGAVGYSFAQVITNLAGVWLLRL